MELDFDKYCLVDSSPTTVLPPPRHCTTVPNRKPREKPKYGKDIACLNQNFTEINFSHYRSASCRDVRSERLKEEGDEVLKRVSVERKKIEFSQGTKSAFPFEIIDSLCSSDEDSSLVEPNRSLEMSFSEQSISSVFRNQIELRSRDSMIASESVSPREKDRPVNLHKSLSTKLALPLSPAKSENDGSRTSSPKSRFSPVKKMFDPFIKSKSHRSPLSSSNETGTNHNDKSEKPRHVEYNYHCEDKENYNLAVQCSPAHLHGLLKLGNKRGVLFFEFSVKATEDVYVAKTWKIENGLTRVYTFHSLQHRRKSNTRDSSLAGQMHVLCHLCKDDGEMNDSMVTEFVLYDIIHSRKGTTCRDNCEPKEISAKTKTKGVEPKHSQPLTSAELRPELEIAAAIMQVPFEKRESLKLKKNDEKKAKEGVSDISSSLKMHVVIPAGNHSLPVNESGGPSRLLDRWRLGGGCDCGGWDMACPLNVFSNSNVESAEGRSLIDDQNRADLFVQGKKDNVPAFTMRATDDGKYAVDFHAQLSSLQAFSICVAILHAAEASTAVGRKRSNQMSQIDSLRGFAKDEIEKEEEISRANSKMEQDFTSLLARFDFLVATIDR
ncbi:hypothetical protein DH2020_049190 [Rehmannia glutinosa]|uniref:Uncharacterized protein n=1 Tax=Rehmannia glutinosa TaxID=99300 RepID=A0ABR0U3T8_REHGL